MCKVLLIEDGQIIRYVNVPEIDNDDTIFAVHTDAYPDAIDLNTFLIDGEFFLVEKHELEQIHQSDTLYSQLVDRMIHRGLAKNNTLDVGL